MSAKRDVLSKRERVERTLNFLPIDRVAIHDHILNPGVISLYTGRRITEFNYSLDDVSETTRKTMDMCRFPGIPRGTNRVTTEDGFIMQMDNWTEWFVKRPFNDVKGLREYYLRSIEKMETAKFNPEKERENYRKKFLAIQKLLGNTVIMDVSMVGLDPGWTRAGIELFTFLYYEEPKVISQWIQVFNETEIKRAHATADEELSPVILVAADIATKQGPIFSPEFLRKEHFPGLTRLVQAWHSHGIKVIYHSDGNWKKLISDFIKCGVDGFYCLEPAVGMDIIELKKKYPKIIWAGGLDGVDLMERRDPDDVRKEVRRQIEETDALSSGGLFLGTSSEINPPIKPENYQAMIEEAWSIRNKDFY